MVPVQAPNRRSDDRFRFSPAYTRVVVIPSAPRKAVLQGASLFDGLDLSGFEAGLGTPAGGLEGHGYDISMSGMRFELDDELPAGTEVSVDVYPPAEREPIRMRAVVVRVFAHDDDPGPRRMAVQFTAFERPEDRDRLARRLDSRACCWPE